MTIFQFLTIFMVLGWIQKVELLLESKQYSILSQAKLREPIKNNKLVIVTESNQTRSTVGSETSKRSLLSSKNGQTWTLKLKQQIDKAALRITLP